jgi:triacylglycerol lipase
VRTSLYDESMRMLLRMLGEKGRSEVTRWLEGIGDDQGALAQLTPEAMDIFNLGITNASGVKYGCVVNASPAPKTRNFVSKLRHPLDALSAPIYATIYGIAASEHVRYKSPEASALTRERFLERMPFEVTGRANDGIVPTLSMVWGDVIWAGPADHLDLIGHFYGGASARDHVDWISSGAKYGLPEFDSQMDAMAKHVLSA